MVLRPKINFKMKCISREDFIEFCLDGKLGR